MKKKFLVALIALVCALACVLSLAACGGRPGDGGHTHNYQWVDNGDGTHKQHCSADGCDAPDINVGSHDFMGGDCVCGKTQPDEGHTHDWSMGWESDETHHWHTCTGEGCTVSANSQNDGYAEHDFTNGDCVCGERHRHDWRETVIKEATCTEDGNGLLKCAWCGDVEEKIYPALSHRIEWDCGYSTHEGYCKNRGCDFVIEKHSHTWLTDNTCADCAYKLPYTDNLIYTLQKEEYAVAVPKTLKEEDLRGQDCVVFPVYHDGLPVTAIAARGFNAPKLPNIVSAIYLPDTIRTVGVMAFSSCKSLTEITIAGDVSIGTYAFSHTGYYEDENNWVNDILYLGKYLLTAKSDIENAQIKEGTEVICQSAFSLCSRMEKIRIPSSISRIDDNAFGSVNITDVYYDGNIEQWCNIDISPSANVFYSNYSWDEKYCSNFYINGNERVSTITVPGTVKKVPENAFYGCRNVTQVTVEEGVTEIGDKAFCCYGLKKVSIPNSLERLGDFVFPFGSIGTDDYEYTQYNNGYYVGNASNPYLILIRASGGSSSQPATNFAAHSRTKFIYSNAASNNINKLTSVTIPSGVVSIGEEAFRNHEISNLTLPSSIKRIGEAAFALNNFSSVSIPEGVEEIDCNAFLGVKSVYYGGTFEQWNSVRLGGKADWWLEYNQISYGGTYCGIAGDYDLYIGGTPIESIEIPSSVETIGAQVFTGTKISSVTIPDTVKTVGEGAFSHCRSLTSVKLGKGVKIIPDGAFSRCGALSSVEIPDGVKYIGASAFVSCAKLTSIDLPDSVAGIGDRAFMSCSGLTSIIIPEGVTKIDSYTFSSCVGLTSITIPSSVVEIGDNVFSDCSSLTKIIFNGTKEQWGAIEKGNNFWYYTQNCAIIYTEDDDENQSES